MLTITFVLPSGVKVKASLKKREVQKIIDEAKLYHPPKMKRTFWQWVKFFWIRKVKVRWVRVREWIKRNYRTWNPWTASESGHDQAVPKVEGAIGPRLR